MDARAILDTLRLDEAAEQTRGGYWATMPASDVRAMADLMLAHGVRLITLTARPDASGGYRIIYHWDAGSTLVNVPVSVTDGSIPTIADILPAADWVEREIRDYYALEFEGRAETPALMLREDDEPGLFSRTCELGNDVDPAKASHAAAAAEAGEPR